MEIRRVRHAGIFSSLTDLWNTRAQIYRQCNIFNYHSCNKVSRFI